MGVTCSSTLQPTHINDGDIHVKLNLCDVLLPLLFWRKNAKPFKMTNVLERDRTF